MKLTETYINNRSNPRTCIWFRANKHYFLFLFKSNTKTNRLQIAPIGGYTFGNWLEDKTIIILTKQEGKELCN